MGNPIKLFAVFEDDSHHLDVLSQAMAAAGDCEIAGIATNPHEARILIAALAAGEIAAHFAVVDGNLNGGGPKRDEGADARLVVDLLKTQAPWVIPIDYSSSGFREIGLGSAPHEVYKFAGLPHQTSFFQNLPVPEPR